jgi:dimethylamine monooxygenase subunit B
VTHAETIPVEVAAVEPVTPLITRFTLRPVGGGVLPPFSGGSHVIVVVRAGDRTFRNPYSLAGSPWDLQTYQIAVRRLDDGRGGSAYLHGQVTVGTRLEVSHPVNLFPLAGLGRGHVLIAGGVGITPITAMAADLARGGAPWELHYAVRGPGHDFFGRVLRERYGELVRVYHGRVIDFDRVLADRPLGTHVYTCGPAGMIDAVGRAARAAGWPDSHIHFERFAAPPVGGPFEARLARSGLTVLVPPERSLLEAMEAAGVDAPYLCRGGACGECETDVLELDGELIHNDHWLSAEDRAAGRKVMPCVSRARGTRLVIDR